MIYLTSDMTDDLFQSLCEQYQVNNNNSEMMVKHFINKDNVKLEELRFYK